MRRVVVQVHISRAAKSGGAAAFKAHVKYLQRDGVDRDGRKGVLYDRDQDRITDKDFLDRSENDRHQFRIMVSPEDGAELGDLKPHIRAYMAGVEKDLGTRLYWVAVDHHNTGQPHTHIVVRGRAEDGTDLVIDRNYLTQGLRRKASELVTEALGPRRELDILRAEARDVDAERFTKLDRAIADSEMDGRVTPVSAETTRDRFEQALQIKRLKRLETMGLATATPDRSWQLQDGWSETLKAMGRRKDVIRTLSATFAERDLANRFRLFEPTPGTSVSGRVIGSIPANETRGTRLIIVDGVDGQSWGVELSTEGNAALPSKGAIIAVQPKPAAPRRSDRTIARVAALNEGLWSEARHAAIDPASSPEYRLAHKRRLEALRRASIVQRLSSGDWKIGDDFLEKAAAYEARTGPSGVRERTGKSLNTMTKAEALTWLDDVDLSSLSETGFGGETRRAIAARQAWLRETGRLGPGEDTLSPDTRAELLHSELTALASAEARASAREPVTLGRGQTFEGRLERKLGTHQGPMALVGNQKQFALIKWRSGMGAALGRDISLTRKGPGIDWAIGRKRGLSR